MDELTSTLLPRTELGYVGITLRLTVATLMGGLIGLDREIKNRPAGLRTHMLVALASALFSIVAIELVSAIEPGGEAKGDPVRIIEAVTAGVAFLAAGAIIRSGAKVEGLTTGAGLWLAGAVGLACGVGLWTLAAIAVGIGLLVLVVVGFLLKSTDSADSQ
jgi:putative Mg2+ transporter-C (MgtC) family protein